MQYFFVAGEHKSNLSVLHFMGRMRPLSPRRRRIPHRWSASRWQLVTVILIASLFPVMSRAARFTSFEEERGAVPRTYQEIQQEIARLQSHIENNVSCGGWVDAAQLSPGGAGLLTTVEGAPGRSGDPLASPESGMASRGSFTYPDEAAGYMSACHIQDPECNPANLCLIGEQTATPLQCRELYYQLLEKKQSAPRPDPVCGIQIPTKFDFTEACTGSQCRCGIERVCTDNGTGLRCSDLPNQPNAEGVCDPGFWIEQYPVCVVGADGGLIILSPLVARARLAPFYRHYGPVSSSEAIPEERYDRGILVSSEGKEQRVAADCYEYYIERDALTNRIPDWQRRCELYETDDSDDDKDSPEWPDEEWQKAAVKPDGSREPYRPEDMNPPRSSGSVMAPWIPDTATSMALLDMQTEEPPETRSVNPDDLAPSLPVAPQTVLTASRTSGTARTDPFDDTTNPAGNEQRVFSEWWEDQQRKLQTISKAPVLRVLLPARYGIGLSSNDPLTAFLDGSAPRSSGVVEKTLLAGNDDVGSVLSALEQSLLLVPRERRIPVIVPVQSELEIETVIDDWRQWEIQFDAPDAAADIIEKLEEYREQVRRVRLLRIGAASSLAHLVEVQQSIRNELSMWYLKNAENLETWTRDASGRREVQERWRDVMETLVSIHDGCELKWCSNARYSLPVYSLLDEWLPGRPSLGAFADDSSYLIPEREPAEDWVIDFSALALPREPLFIPSLEVTQVRLALPIPPKGKYAVPSADDMPDIPLLPLEELDPFTLFDDVMTETDVTPPSLSDDEHYVPVAPEEQEYEDVLEVLENIDRLLISARGGMCSFRESIEGRDDQPRKIKHTEFDLRERIARLFARRAPLREEDYQGRVERKGDAEPSCDDDVLCDVHPPERSLSFRWLLTAPQDSALRFQELAERLRALLLPSDDEANPYENSPLPTLERVFVPSLREDVEGVIDGIDLSVPAPSSAP